MRQIKLLYVVNEFIEASSNELVYHLVKHLNPAQYQIFAGSIKGDSGVMAGRMQDAGATIVRLVPGNAIANIRNVIESEQIDIVHTHVLRADVLGGIAARRSPEVMLISTKHNIGYVPSQAGWLKRTLLYWPAMLLPNRIVIVTDAAREKVLRVPFVTEKRVVTIHNGINIERYSATTTRHIMRQEFGIDEGVPLLIYVGRLVGGKGLHDLLATMEQLQADDTPAHLLIAGDGELREELVTAVAERGLGDCVTFAGFRRDVPDLLSAADIFVLPSRSEGLPLSLMEAMAAGRAVVVTPVGGMSGMVHAEETGLFVPVADVGALTAAINRLIHDTDLQRRLGEAARAHIRKHGSIERMVTAYDRLYQECMTERLSPEGDKTHGRHDRQTAAYPDDHASPGT